MDPLKNFLFIDQLKIMGYGESDTSGCWIKFQLTPELLEVVRGRKGEMVEVAARLIDNSGEYVQPPDPKPKPEPGPGPHGKFWHRLIRHGTFNAPDVLEAIGTDEDFRHWIHKQPSCLSGQRDWVEEEGEGRCEAAHIRRISEGAGTAIKPDYYCVPMTHTEHFQQHQSGEAATLNLHGPKKPKKPDNSISSYTEAQAAAWFANRAQRYRTEWASQTLAETLGYGRRSACPSSAVQVFIDQWDLGRFFPKPLDVEDA